MTPRRTKIAALVAGCAVVAGGGYAAADALSSPAASPAAGNSAQVSPATGGGAPAALSSLVNGASLSSASTAADAAGGSAAGNSTATGVKARRLRARRELAALRRLPGEYGQYTYETRKGQKVLAFERGTVTSVSGQAVTVKAANGHTENWTLTGRTAVREAGAKTTASALADGKKVLVAGPVSGSVQDARVIVIRDKAAGKTSGKSSSASAAVSAS